MLRQPIYQPTSPSGLNLKFGYFCIKILFFIKGCSKFRKMDFEEFSLVSLPTGLVLRFCQGVSKNWQIEVTICLASSHKPCVDCLVENAITTFNKLTC
jgi:hypothetical protein